MTPSEHLLVAAQGFSGTGTNSVAVVSTDRSEILFELGDILTRADYFVVGTDTYFGASSSAGLWSLYRQRGALLEQVAGPGTTEVPVLLTHSRALSHYLLPGVGLIELTEDELLCGE